MPSFYAQVPVEYDGEVRRNRNYVCLNRVMITGYRLPMSPDKLIRLKVCIFESMRVQNFGSVESAQFI